MVALNINDLQHILAQIKIAEEHMRLIGTGMDPREALASLVPNGLTPWGLRTVDGSYNNFQPNQVQFGSADELMTRATDPVWIDAGLNPRTGLPTSYTQLTGSVYDSAPRTISNLVADQTLNNPAAIAAALAVNGVTGMALLNTVTEIQTAFRAVEAAKAIPDNQIAIDAAQVALDVLTTAHNITMDLHGTVLVPNVSADLGDTAPYNGFFTIFGQFFDHGLDSTAKGNAGTVYIPLLPDDPLYVEGSPTNFMALTRATNQPGLDGILGTADDVRENNNSTTPWIDLNQVYTSNQSHQVFLREYIMVDGKPVATGHMLEGAAGGPPTWADIKAQARTMLGIELGDLDVLRVPSLVTDLYGEFTRGANGLPMLMTAGGAVEGNLATPVLASLAIPAGRAFLDDIAHSAAPGMVDHDRNPLTPMIARTADADTDTGNVIAPDAQTGVMLSYDDELLNAHFIVGDGRGNENIALTSIHTIFHSEHNNQVDSIKTLVQTSGDLAFINSWLLAPLAELPAADAVLTWDGERLFQAARFSTEQVYQHLVFEEFVRTIAPQIDAFIFSNTVDINPVIMQEFAQVVYRFGHSMLNENVDMLKAVVGLDGVTTAADFDQAGLIESFLNPVAYSQVGGDAYAAAGAVLRGMTRQVGNEIDEFLTEALRNNLVGLPLDLAALNMARARDVGIPSLNEFRREIFAQTNDTFLKPYVSWTDFAQHIKNPMSVVNFIAAYGTHETIVEATTTEAKRDAAMKLVFGGAGAPADRLDYVNARGTWAGVETGLNNVDFWIGGLAEAKMTFGGMLGSTFTIVFEKQIEMLQDGDRFYYLSRSQGLNLLNELEADSFSELIRRNTDTEHVGLHINGAAFQTAAYVLEMDQALQYNEGLGTLDPTGGDPIMSMMLGHESLVERGVNSIKFLGGDHVVLGGTNGDDTMTGGSGDDAIWGEGGNDTIEGGLGVDHIYGGDGDDVITDMGSDIGEFDVIHGNAGNDVINAGQGLDLVFAGDGQDFVFGGSEFKDIFGGEGNDFISGPSDGSVLMGNEGNDWIEGGDGFDGVTGDNSQLFFNSTIIGHDVLNGGKNDTDYDGESGDDIMFQNGGIQRNNGMAGFDWAIHQGDIAAADSDMNVNIFVNQQALILRDRFDLVEGLSGWVHNDKLTGRDQTLGALGVGGAAAVFTDTAPIESFSNVLLEKNLVLIDGLEELTAHLARFDVVGPTGEVLRGVMDTQDASDIILGGAGDDVIAGLAGNDILDGDKFLQVRIGIKDANGVVFASAFGMNQEVRDLAGNVLFEGRTLDRLMFSRDVNPGNLEIIREIVTGGTSADLDTALYGDVMANYTVVKNLDGSFSVTHDTVTVGTISALTGKTLLDEGTDHLTNIERLQFSDGEMYIVNRPATGAPVISDTTPTENQQLTATTTSIADPNGLGAFTYQWQTSLDGTTWTNVGTNSVNYTPSQPQVGQLIRVQVSFVDGLGNPELVSSLPTAIVVDSNVLPTGVPTINDTTPAVGQTLTANSLGISDANGFNIFTPRTYQWEVQNADTTWSVIAGATSASFTTTAAQVGAALRVSVSFTDGEGTLEKVYSAATSAVGNTITGTNAANTLTGTAGGDVITGLQGNDTINAGAGDDEIVWNANNALFNNVTDGSDFVDGGAGIDTMDINTRDLSAEVYRIYTRAAAIAANIAITNANTEIVITRGQTALFGGTTYTKILELDNIEEIIVGTRNVTGAPGGAPGTTPSAGGAGGVLADTVQIFGDFSTTSLLLNTITINGSAGNDTVDISALESAHRIVFRTAGGNDTVVGTLRAQDVIELPVGANAADYVPTDNGDGTVTLASAVHSVVFTGTVDALPTLTPAPEPTPIVVDPAAPVEPTPTPTPHPIDFGNAALTASDVANLTNLVRNITSVPEDNANNEGVAGYRDLAGMENNVAQPGLGAAGQPFLRLTDAHYGVLDQATGTNTLNSMFDGLDPRNISNIIGTQGPDVAPSADINMFFTAFGQYFDHGLTFIPKGGNGSVQIGDLVPRGPNNPADLTRASIAGWDANGVPEHTNITSPFVDQNQVYGSSNLVGQLLRATDGNQGFGAHLVRGDIDPSNTAFTLLPNLRQILDHHIEAGTIFTGPFLPEGGQTLLEFYPGLIVDGAYDPLVVKALVSNFMGEGYPLLLDTNPFINLLDHVIAGDGRANENITLTSMHEIWSRNHEFHVANLEAAGFVGTPEELFQAAKIINEAEYQRTVFTEFAEKLLGGVGIRGTGDHGFSGYNPATDAGISHEFAAAVYRVGHTMVGENVDILNADGTTRSMTLFDAFLNPTSDEGAFTMPLSTLAQYGYVPQPGYEQIGAGAILGGIVGQQAEAVDVHMVDAIRNDLVRISADLFSFNVARGRDLGLGTLNQVRMSLDTSESSYVREAVGYVGGLTAYADWTDFQTRNNLSDTMIEAFKLAYPDLVLDTEAKIAAFTASNPDIVLIDNLDGTFTVKGIDRVDLWVGGLAEAKFEGAQVGSTFWVVLHEQLDRLQEGDRFYYIDRLENFDLYGNFVEGEGFAAIVARNTGLTGLDERIFEVSNQDNIPVALPVVDAPVVDAPVVDAPVVDAPVVDAPVVDAPVVDAPVVDAPVVDAPVVDAPVVDAPVVDAPVVDAPVVDAPVVDAPVVDAPVVDAPVVDAPVVDTPVVDAPVVDAPVVDAPVVDTPVVTPPVVDTPVVPVDTVPVAPVRYFGTALADAAVGGEGADIMLGRGGDDALIGEGGNDVLRGEEGDDFLSGDAGRDMIFGGTGNDDILAGQDADMVYGDDGQDRLFGNEGDDILNGGLGDDTLHGDEGDDLFVASEGDGDDVYDGGIGTDTLDMSAILANITVDLGIGLMGRGASTGTGYDSLNGIENVVTGRGADTIMANAAVNVLDGGEGDNTFVFRSVADAKGDTILGFNAGDVIDLSGINANSPTGAFTLVGRGMEAGAGELAFSHLTEDGHDMTVITGNTGTDAFELKVQGHHEMTNDQFSF